MTPVPETKQKRRFVIALGGNAIIPANQEGAYQEQVRRTRDTMDKVAQLAAAGHSLVLTHGNGPVVGNILLRNDAGFEIHGIPRMPLYICGADSQGGIGYMIQQCLQNALGGLGLNRPVVSVVTQVIVDENDSAFASPTKPIGPFYDREKAKEFERTRGWSVVEDANRGWRRVVASPKPVEVVESAAIRTLYQDGVIAIAVGGGGVPVVRDANGQLRGVAAVIDKDRASALLGKLIGADTLVIITSVDRVYRRFGQPDQEPLALLDIPAAEALVRDGEFPAGSMGPKIEAALSFLKGGGREVIITNSDSLLAALDGQAGTRLLRAVP